MFRSKKNDNSGDSRYYKILNEVVGYLPGNPKDEITVEDLCRGTFISGGTGSGKSSGSGKWLADLFMEKGYGGFVTCAKPDDRQFWEELAEKHGRTDDLIIMSEDSGLQYNFLQAEMIRSGKGGGEVSNITNLLMIAQDLYQNFAAGSGGGGQEGDFWVKGLRRMINRMVSLIKLSGETMSMENLRNILLSAPTLEEVQAYEKLILTIRSIHSDPHQSEALERLRACNQQMERMEQKSYCIHLLNLANKKLDIHAPDFKKRKRSFNMVYTYFTKNYPKLSQKMQSTFNEFYLGIAEPFLDGILRDIFSEGISPEVHPRNLLEGKILIMDFSIKEYQLAGVLANGLMKYIIQQFMEQRKPKEEEDPRPTFIFIDESQLLMLPESDSEHQTTARSSLVMTVYLTQSINNYYFTMGGQHAESRAKSLLSNLALKIFHANSCFDTNEFAAQVIGKDYRSSHTINENGGSLSKEFQYQVLPKEFSMLRTGGRRNDFRVEAIVNLTGRTWSNKENWLKVTFHQKS
jgi:hypothetical protein